MCCRPSLVPPDGVVGVRGQAQTDGAGHVLGMQAETARFRSWLALSRVPRYGWVVSRIW